MGSPEKRRTRLKKKRGITKKEGDIREGSPLNLPQERGCMRTVTFVFIKESRGIFNAKQENNHQGRISFVKERRIIESLAAKKM